MVGCVGWGGAKGGALGVDDGLGAGVEEGYWDLSDSKVIREDKSEEDSGRGTREGEQELRVRGEGARGGGEEERTGP